MHKKNIIYKDYIDEINFPKTNNNNNMISSLIINNEFVNLDILNENDINNVKSDIDNKMIIFDTTQYLEKIMISYNNNLNTIINQFKSDHARSEVYLNNSKITEAVDLVEQLLKYSRFRINLCNTIFPLDVIIQMLCTQASFVFSFVLMNKLYTNYKNGKHVTSNKSKYYINIKNPDIVDIKLDAIYFIKDVNKNIIVSKVNVITSITAVYKKKQYEFCKWGIINWNFI